MSKITVTNHELVEIIDKIMPVVDGLPVTSVTLACIAIAIMLQSPEADINELSEGLQETSRFIVSFIEKRHPSTAGIDLPLNQQN